ncbi:C6 transcription factor [Penicillium cosmopolitanum]|uniref:C6 transcription factor n=1 Tax=Penicillium cosmopolitanum TaxID=1131564 RepID=A0A9X0B7Y0_9EURO|nr:C6 transcription factor [Penicillium cosmopolitanum]KAJ5391474.1 C6 transcription factor [Penicillium cosmopolitanum]
MGSESPGNLDATELSLLSRYLAHTSRTIPFDDLDLYALSVGIPNLAFNSKPVMSSLIALAAACKSHDIVNTTQTPLADQTVMEVQRLLELAESHHRASLQYIQEAVSNSSWYDNVLANAALMVLYASASHSIRVRLAAIARRNGKGLPNDVLPQHSQWITFTRAAHTAASAVLSGLLNADMNRNVTISPTVFTSPHPISTILTPQSGPSENTKRLFIPLVTSTYGRALESLRRKVESVSDSFRSQESLRLHNLDLDACLNTLPTLEKCAFSALSGGNIKNKSNTVNDTPTISGEYSQVSPWVANYMLSVTSMTAPKALRRTIMSFLNEAPTEYLNLVQSVLDSSSVEAYTGDWVARGSPKGEMQPLDTTHLLAMDIFAHWLVLVMLLDGVWWIGGIGRWELGQIVSLMKTQELLNQPPDTMETWWPESMYLVNMELMPDI